MSETRSPLEIVFDDLADYLPGDVKIYGPHQADRAKDTRYLSWEPESVVHVPAERLGGGAEKPGSLWVRNFRVSVHIWDKTFEKVETLLAQFVDVVHKRLTHNGYRLDGEEWMTGRANTKGMDVVLHLVVRIPFVRLEPTVQTIEELLGEAHISEDQPVTIGPIPPDE